MTTMPQRESTIAVPDDRRKQLGAFLRARRESLDPQRLGLPRVGRRRTPGLRREEVAMLADVGVTWYTWLEQGREVNPSEAVLVGARGRKAVCLRMRKSRSWRPRAEPSQFASWNVLVSLLRRCHKAIRVWIFVRRRRTLNSALRLRLTAVGRPSWM